MLVAGANIEPFLIYPKQFYKKIYSYLRQSKNQNMIVTVEPGIYIPKKVGIRIEDTGIVTKKGFIPLTKSTQELIVFKKM